MLPLSDLLVLALVGAIGATGYSAPVYFKARAEVPPAAFALARLCLAVILGAIAAPVTVPAFGYHWPWMVQPNALPLAFAIGLGVNPLLPIFVRRLEKLGETFTPGGLK